MTSLGYKIGIFAIFIVLIALIAQSCALENKDGDYYYKLAMESLANDSIDEAFCQIDKSVSLYKKDNNKEKEAGARILLGMLYFSNNQKEKAYEIIKELDISPNDTCNYLLKSNYFRIKGFYKSQIEKDKEEALRCIDVVINNDKYIEDSSSRHHTIIDMLNKAEFLLNADETERAEDIIREIELMVDCDSTYYPQLYVNKARIMENKGACDSAYLFSEVVVKTTKKIYQDRDNLLEALNIMMRHDMAANDFPSYIKHRDHYEDILKEQRGDEAALWMDLLSTRNKMELAELSYQNKNQTYAMWGVIIVSVFLITILLIIFKYKSAKRQKQLIQLECDKLDAECFKRKLECELYARKMEARDEEMKKINQDLLDLSYRLAVIDKTNASNDKESSKNHLERLHTKVMAEHPEFNKRMISLFPSITKTELILAELIRLNLRTEEITSTMNISAAGLIKARYRLRKKLGVESSSELDSYIASI